MTPEEYYKGEPKKEPDPLPQVPKTPTPFHLKSKGEKVWEVFSLGFEKAYGRRVVIGVDVHADTFDRLMEMVEQTNAQPNDILHLGCHNGQLLKDAMLEGTIPFKEMVFSTNKKRK